MTDYDSPWKEALDAYFEPFMAFFFPDAHSDIDWSRGYESLDKELQKIVHEGELGRRHVDKLVKVWLKDGREQWVLIHIEVQADEDAAFGERMFVYSYRLFDRYNRREVVSIAVLADDPTLLAAFSGELYSSSRWGLRNRHSFSGREAAGLCGASGVAGEACQSVRDCRFSTFENARNAARRPRTIFVED